MADAYIGEIRLFAGNFAPKDWAICDGSLLAISQNTALFSILGTQYGGDGKTTFALPDLRGRVPIHFGTGAGLTPRVMGEEGGSATVTLLTTQMPAHTHQAVAVAAAGSSTSPEGSVWAESVKSGAHSPQPPLYDPTATVTMNPSVLGVAGGSQPHNNMQPYLGLNYIICLYGFFPPRQ